MSTVDRVEAAVMVSMLRGELAPGTRLRQDELAEQLSVSKIPVREALQRLAANDLLRFESNRGVVVPELTAADAIEIFSLRRGIETQLLERALPLLSIVDLAEAEVALGPGGGSLTEQNWVFHRSLYQASRWQRGLAIAETLHVAVAPYVLLYTEGLGGGGDSEAEHRLLLDACRIGDVSAALAVLGSHIDHAERALVDFLAEAD